MRLEAWKQVLEAHDLDWVEVGRMMWNVSFAKGKVHHKSRDLNILGE